MAQMAQRIEPSSGFSVSGAARGARQALRPVVLCAALGALLTLLTRARAEPGWLQVHSDGSCGVADLERRIEGAVAGPQNPALQVEVALERAAGQATALGPEAHAGSAPTRAQVRLWLGGHAVGEKRLEADSCDEARDAVVAVAALALSTTPLAKLEHAAEGAPNGAAADTRSAPHTPRAAQPVSAPSQRADQVERPEPGSQSAAWRVWLGVGIDAGSLAQPTALVSGGGAHAWQRAELRLLGRYGVRVTNEQVEASIDRMRSEYGSVALDACLGLDRRRWLSLCGGLELRLKRVQRLSGPETAPRAEASRLEPSLGPAAALALVLRSVVAQPQLELSAQVPVLGAPSALAFRAALGGGMPF